MSLIFSHMRHRNKYNVTEINILIIRHFTDIDMFQDVVNVCKIASKSYVFCNELGSTATH